MGTVQRVNSAHSSGLWLRRLTLSLGGFRDVFTLFPVIVCTDYIVNNVCSSGNPNVLSRDIAYSFSFRSRTVNIILCFIISCSARCLILGSLVPSLPSNDTHLFNSTVHLLRWLKRVHQTLERASLGCCVLRFLLTGEHSLPFTLIAAMLSAYPSIDECTFYSKTFSHRRHAIAPLHLDVLRKKHHGSLECTLDQ